ncbi:MAG: sensor histidine kinase [Bacillota bacterium]
MFTSFENRQVIEVSNPGNYLWLNIAVDPTTNSSGWLPSFAIPGTITEAARPSFIMKRKIKSIFINRPIGEACIAVEEYYIRHNLLDSIREGPKGIVMLLDQKGTVLSAVTGKSIFQQKLPQNPYVRKILNEEKDSFVERINGEKMLVGFTTSKYTGWKYVSMVPLREVTLNTVEISNLALLVNLLSASLAILLAWIFSQSIYHPIRVLKESMKLAEAGNLDVRIYEKRRDEFAMLNRGFNKMINRIQRLIDELYHEKLLKKEAELKNFTIVRLKIE